MERRSCGWMPLPMRRRHRERKTSSMIRRHGNFYRRFMRWQNLWDLRFCRRFTQRMTKKYTRRLQKKAMRPTIFSCRDWSLMRLRTGAEHTLRHGRRKLWKRRSPRSTCLAVTTASRFCRFLCGSFRLFFLLGTYHFF